MFRWTLTLTVLACLMPLSPNVAQAGDTESLIVNGQLQDADGDGFPDDWYKLTRDEGRVQMLSEEGEPFVRLGRGDEPDNCILQQWPAIPQTTQLKLSAKVRWTDIVKGDANWKAAAIGLIFADDDHKRIGSHHNLQSMVYSSDGWQTIEQTFDVPEGATRFRVQVALFHVDGGHLDVAWVKAQGMGEPLASTAERLPLPEGDGPEYGGVRGVDLIGGEPIDVLQPYRKVEDFSVQRVVVEDQPFDSALRISTDNRPDFSWDMQARGKAAAAISAGDKLLLTMWVRGVSAETEFDEVTFRVTLELDEKPYTKVVDLTVRQPIRDEWRKIEKVFVADQTLSADRLAVSLQFGFDQQTFEVGGLSLYNYGPTVDVTQLPATPEKLYDGYEADHPWRAEAAERIERFRKGDLTVRVVDPDGNPVPDASVRVEMTRHAFHWGTAMYRWYIASDDPAHQKYRDNAAELFNMVATENAFKWRDWDTGSSSREATENLVNWAKANDMKLRGHTVLWASFTKAPDRLAELKDQPEALRAEIDRHIREMVGQYAGRVDEWDVLNEPYTKWDFFSILGKTEAAHWFKLVQEIDPQAGLFINENSILKGTKLARYDQWIEEILAAGGPLSGIGIQGHLSAGAVSPLRMLATFDRLGRHGVPLALTEVDVISDDPQAQATYLRDYMTAAFSHPALNGMTFWGYWEGRHWKDNTPFYTKDWQPKPGLDVYRDLVFKQWWTDVTLTTDADGGISTQAFLGDYRITATHDGLAQTFIGTLGRDGGTWTVQFQPVDRVPASQVKRVDPLPTYTQDFELQFASAEQAKAAEVSIAPLYDDAQWAFSARWDDNRSNNYAVHKLMVEHGIKGTFYLNDASTPEAREAAQRLTRGGTTIGAHTRTHGLLTAMSPNEMLYETLGNRVEWESLTDQPVNTLAFPFGRYRTRGYDQVYADVTQALLRAGIVHTTYRIFNKNNPHLPEHAIVGSHEVRPGDRRIDLAKFDQQMNELLDDRDAAIGQSYGIHMGVHAQQTGKELQKLGQVFAKYAGNADWWYCSLTDFAGYRHQANHARVERVSMNDATVRFCLTRPTAGASGSALPLTLRIKNGDVKSAMIDDVEIATKKISDSVLLNLSHAEAAGLPTRIDLIDNPDNRPVGSSAEASADFPALGAWLWVDENGVPMLRLHNDGDSPIRNLHATLRLPMNHGPGVVRFELPDVEPGQACVVGFEVDKPEADLRFASGPDYHVAELNFQYGNKPGRIYATTRGRTPGVDEVVLRDAAHMMGPWRSPPHSGVFEAISKPDAKWADLADSPDRQWFIATPDQSARFDAHRASLYRDLESWKQLAKAYDYMAQTYAIGVDFELSRPTELKIRTEGEIQATILNGKTFGSTDPLPGVKGRNRLILTVSVNDGRAQWTAFPLFLQVKPVEGELLYNRAD